MVTQSILKLYCVSYFYNNYYIIVSDSVNSKTLNHEDIIKLSEYLKFFPFYCDRLFQMWYTNYHITDKICIFLFSILNLFAFLVSYTRLINLKSTIQIILNEGNTISIQLNLMNKRRHFKNMLNIGNETLDPDKTNSNIFRCSGIWELYHLIFYFLD